MCLGVSSSDGCPGMLEALFESSIFRLSPSKRSIFHHVIQYTYSPIKLQTIQGGSVHDMFLIILTMLILNPTHLKLILIQSNTNNLVFNYWKFLFSGFDRRPDRTTLWCCDKLVALKWSWVRWVSGKWRKNRRHRYWLSGSASSTRSTSRTLRDFSPGISDNQPVLPRIRSLPRWCKTLAAGTARYPLPNTRPGWCNVRECWTAFPSSSQCTEYFQRPDRICKSR